MASRLFIDLKWAWLCYGEDDDGDDDDDNDDVERKKWKTTEVELWCDQL